MSFRTFRDFLEKNSPQSNFPKPYVLLLFLYFNIKYFFALSFYIEILSSFFLNSEIDISTLQNELILHSIFLSIPG